MAQISWYVAVAGWKIRIQIVINVQLISSRQNLGFYCRCIHIWESPIARLFDGFNMWLVTMYLFVSNYFNIVIYIFYKLEMSIIINSLFPLQFIWYLPFNRRESSMMFLFCGVPKLVADIGEDWTDLKAAPVGVFIKVCLVALSKSLLRSYSSRCRFMSHLKNCLY